MEPGEEKIADGNVGALRALKHLFEALEEGGIGSRGEDVGGNTWRSGHQSGLTVKDGFAVTALATYM
jgi:hypothetical protein